METTSPARNKKNMNSAGTHISLFLTSGVVTNGPQPTGVVEALDAGLLHIGVGDGVVVGGVPQTDV